MMTPGDSDKIPDVIVPTLNAERHLRSLLISLLTGGVPSIAITVVDGGSQDKTISIARDLGIRVESIGRDPGNEPGVRAPGGIAAARNAGLELTTRPKVIFLDADMEVNTRALAEVLTALASGSVAVVLPEITTGDSFLGRVRGWQREAWSRSGVNLAPRAFDVSVLRHLHGYRTDMVGLEDLELKARIEEAGLPITVTTTPILHHEEGLTLREYLRKRWKYAHASTILNKLHPDYASRLFALSPRILALGRKFREDPKLEPLVGALVLGAAEGLFTLGNLTLRS